MESETLHIRDPDPSEMDWVARASVEIGGPVIASLGRLYELRRHPMRIALLGPKPVGFVVYRPDGDNIEILAICACRRHAGIGTALLTDIERLARHDAVKRLWLTTTNDNLDAIRFYQRRGFRVRRYHIDGFEDIQRLKGEVVTTVTGHFGIATRDIIEFSKPLDI